MVSIRTQKKLRLAIGLVLLLCAAGCSSRQTTISGTVSAMADGAPIHNASISVDSGTARSDRDGHFSLEAPSVGEVAVRVEAVGYEAYERAISIASGSQLILQVPLRALAVPDELPPAGPDATSETPSHETETQPVPPAGSDQAPLTDTGSDGVPAHATDTDLPGTEAETHQHSDAAARFDCELCFCDSSDSRAALPNRETRPYDLLGGEILDAVVLPGSDGVLILTTSGLLARSTDTLHRAWAFDSTGDAVPHMHTGSIVVSPEHYYVYGTSALAPWSSVIPFGYLQHRIDRSFLINEMYLHEGIEARVISRSMDAVLALATTSRVGDWSADRGQLALMRGAEIVWRGPGGAGAISPGGEELVYVHEDGSFQILRVTETGAHHASTISVATLIAEAYHGVSTMAITNGAETVVATVDNHAYVVDADQGVVRHDLAWHDSDVSCLALPENGLRLASGCESGTVRIWDLDTGELVETRSMLGHVVRLAWLSSDEYLAVCSLGGIARFHVGEESPVSELPAMGRIESVAYIDEKSLVVLDDWLSRLIVWDLLTASPTAVFEVPEGFIQYMEMAGANAIALVYGDMLPSVVVDLDSGEIQEIPTAVASYHSDSPIDCNAACDCLIRGDDGFLEILNLRTGECRSIDTGGSSANTIAISNSSDLVAYSDVDDLVIVRDVSQTSGSSEVLATLGDRYQYVDALAFSPDGGKLLVSEERDTTIWDATSWAALFHVPHAAANARWSSSGTLLHLDRGLYSVATTEVVRDLEDGLEGGSSFIGSAFSPHSGVIALWDSNAIHFLNVEKYIHRGGSSVQLWLDLTTGQGYLDWDDELRAEFETLGERELMLGDLAQDLHVRVDTGELDPAEAQERVAVEKAALYLDAYALRKAQLERMRPFLEASSPVLLPGLVRLLDELDQASEALESARTWQDKDAAMRLAESEILPVLVDFGQRSVQGLKQYACNSAGMAGQLLPDWSVLRWIFADQEFRRLYDSTVSDALQSGAQ